MAMAKAGRSLTADDWLGLRTLHGALLNIPPSNCAAEAQEGKK
jgi:hypothetical protein